MSAEYFSESSLVTGQMPNDLSLWKIMDTRGILGFVRQRDDAYYPLTSEGIEQRKHDSMTDAAKTLWNRHRTPEYEADVSFAEGAADATRQNLAFSKTWSQCEQEALQASRTRGSLNFSEGRSSSKDRQQWIREQTSQRYHCAKLRAAQASRRVQQLANAR